MRQILAAVLVLLGCAACTSAASQPPASEAPPTTSVAPPTSPPVDPGGPHRHEPVLKVTWTPNLNWKHQQPVTTHGTTAQGRALVHDIRAAQRVPHNGAAYSCPIDFGVRARFVFGAQHGIVDLGGCRFIQFGRHTYRTDQAIGKDLRAVAPHRWLPYLRPRDLK